MKIQLRSGTIGYLDQGKGPAVLLIHAFPLNSSMWAAQMEALSSHYRVVAPDIRGFGESQPASPWTVDAMADDLDELLTRIGIPNCVVAGVSLGGYIALPFWSRHTSRVRQLVLANTRAGADNDTEKTARNEMIAAIEQNGASILPDRMLPRLLKPNPSADAVRLVRGMKLDVLGGNLMHLSLRNCELSENVRRHALYVCIKTTVTNHRDNLRGLPVKMLAAVTVAMTPTLSMLVFVFMPVMMCIVLRTFVMLKLILTVNQHVEFHRVQIRPRDAR